MYSTYNPLCFIGPTIHYVLWTYNPLCFIGPIIEKDFVKLMENNGFKVKQLVHPFSEIILPRIG